MKNNNIKVCLIRRNKPTKEVTISKKRIIVTGVALAVTGGLTLTGLNLFGAPKVVTAFKYL